MKKAFLLFYRLLIISIVLQLLGYFFINNIYLGDRKNIEGKMKFIHVSLASTENADMSMKLPDGAADLQVSYDLAYVSYILDGKLVISSINTGKVVKTINNSFIDAPGGSGRYGTEADIACHKWLSDKNIIMYTINSHGNFPGRVQVVTFDVLSDNIHVSANITGKYIPKGSKVSDMVFSPLNMITHIKVNTNETQALMFRTDIMDKISAPFALDADAIVKMGYYGENLAYQNHKGQIFVRNGSGAVRQLDVPKRSVLLNVTGDSAVGKDVVYIGELGTDDCVKNIIYSVVGTGISKWTRIALSNPVNPKDILFSNDGAIYEVSEKENALVDVSSKKRFDFDGKFICMANKQLVYKKDNRLKSKDLSNY